MAKCPYCKKVTLLGEEEFEKSSFQCSHCKKIVANKARKDKESSKERENRGEKEVESHVEEVKNVKEVEEVKEVKNVKEVKEVKEETKQQAQKESPNTESASPHSEEEPSEEEEEETQEEQEEEEEEEEEEESSQSKNPMLPKLLLAMGFGMFLGYFFSPKPTQEIPQRVEEEWVQPSLPVEEAPFVLQPLARILPEEAVFGATVEEITEANPDLFAMNSQEKHWGEL